MESPCVDICTIDETNGLCTGCGRTLDEIARWATFTDSQRRLIMDQLGERRRAAAAASGAATTGS
ncbi:MAG: DUF1289 domain-containing protein [Hyphomicrobiaceae bacterium]|nr:DUF1289 domain-containing protein [Hyphomicrobiaceae bacterium]